jgi:predicted transcriptional regulator
MSASNPVELAAEIVAAFVSYNPVPKGDLPALIHAMHSAVARLAVGPESAPPQVEAKTPAISIRRSITPDFLICLEDGKRFKALRRHLAGHGLTPEQYRVKWNRNTSCCRARSGFARRPALSPMRIPQHVPRRRRSRGLPE